MYKYFITKLHYFFILVFILFNSNYLYAQEIITYSSDELIKIGIDPNNHQQIIDSLSSDFVRTRLMVIEYCGEMKIYDATEELKLLLENTPFNEEPPYQYSFTERAKILFSLVKLEVITIQEELRDAVLVLSNDSLNIFYLSFFSEYLMQRFNDDFGWQYIKPYYLRGSSQLFGIDVYHLKPFLNSNVSEEVIQALRNLALTDYQADNRLTAINFLTDINDEEIVNIITQASANDPDKMNRFLARENLKKIDLALYINTLKTALETETDYRLFIYNGLLGIGQPAVYKYIVDLYYSNQYPSDSSIIYNELDDPWLLKPQEDGNIVSLLDSLSSTLFQFNSFNWIGNTNFVNEMNTYIQNSRSYYLSNDTINSANQLKLFREEIDQELRDTTDLINDFIKLEARNYLYPRAYFIERIINSREYTDTLISIAPSSAQVGSQTFIAKIVGSGFNNSTLLFWDDNDFLDFEIISPSEIDVIIPNSFLNNPGEYSIVASNALTDYSNSLTFLVTQQSSPNLLVTLTNSQGTQIPASNVKYYDTSWKDAVDNGDGTFTVITTKPTVSVRMFYEGANQTVNNVPAQNNTYSFQTVNASVELRNSSGNLIDEGTVQYYAGTWRSFGTTVNGVANKELLPINLSFRMTYEFGSIDKQQNLSVNPTVIFQTVNAAVELRNSTGALIDQGTVQYYAGAWRNFGTTTNGVANKELLPINYSFRMTYEFGSIDKQQDISVNQTVVFQTVNATVQLQNSLGNLIDQGTVQFYAGAWRSFGTTVNGVANKELLPKNYSFRMTYEFVSNDKQQDLSTNGTVTFSTVLCTVKVTNANNQPLEGADTKYYSVAWRDIGLTNTNGEITKELLPKNLSFRATFGSITQNKQQDIGTNSMVEIQLNVP